MIFRTIEPVGRILDRLLPSTPFALDPPYMTLAHTCEVCRKEVPTPTDNRPVWVWVRAGKPGYYCDDHKPEAP